ncbi:MAG: YbaN family protein [Rhodocyclaceae bacterium]|nr:YbaN family protein [Rhodocyclaceae bacterium]
MPVQQVPTTCANARPDAWRSRAWRCFGSVCVAVGIANAFIPLLPTTVFLILGAWAWGKGAPEWRQRLLDHPRYGPPLRLWLEHRAISRRGKRLCLFGLAASGLLSSWLLDFAVLPTASLFAFLAALGAWIASRREGARGEPSATRSDDGAAPCTPCAAESSTELARSGERMRVG